MLQPTHNPIPLPPPLCESPTYRTIIGRSVGRPIGLGGLTYIVSTYLKLQYGVDVFSSKHLQGCFTVELLGIVEKRNPRYQVSTIYLNEISRGKRGIAPSYTGRLHQAAHWPSPGGQEDFIVIILLGILPLSRFVCVQSGGNRLLSPALTL